MSFRVKLILALLGLASFLVVFFTFHLPPVYSVQRGFRGTGMVHVVEPADAQALVVANRLPERVAPVPAVGPRASAVYQNVQVLGDLTVGEFTRLMVAITNWVAPTSGPNAGCNYCHVAGNMAAEDVYTKQVTRRMLQMVRHINENWSSHVGQAGVTCHTCHRGQVVPANVWAQDPGPMRARGGAADTAQQNVAWPTPAPTAVFTSLPYDPFTPFLGGNPSQIRVVGATPLPTGNLQSIKQTEWTYSLMMHFSDALGVNCTFCHNTRGFASWDQSPPQRATAWYGIRMARDINTNYIDPLQPLWAANPHGPAGGPALPTRVGPLGDALKVNCASCHQGAHRPFLGANMLQDYPELRQVRLTAP
jgi:photosynthetic reaction center cytochrome c subunit